MLCALNLSPYFWKPDYVVYHSVLGTYTNKHYSRLDNLLSDYDWESLCFLFPENSFDYQYQYNTIFCDSFFARDQFVSLYHDFLQQTYGDRLVQWIWLDWHVDWSLTDRLLWKQWDLSWTFFSYHLKPPLTYYFSWDVFFSSLVLPESYPLVHHLSHEIGKTSFVVLHLSQDSAKLFHIVNGCYQLVHSINMGKKYFFRMLHDAGFQHVNFSDVSFSNPLAYKLITEVYDFYITTLFDRLDSFGVFIWPLVVVSDLMTHPIFSDAFCSLWKRRYSSYIVPFDGSVIDNNFDLVYVKLLEHYYSFFLDHSMSL